MPVYVDVHMNICVVFSAQHVDQMRVEYEQKVHIGELVVTEIGDLEISGKHVELVKRVKSLIGAKVSYTLLNLL